MSADETLAWAGAETAAAEAVEQFARKALAASPLYGRESALIYALGWIEPTGRPAAEEVAKIRGVFAGLRAAEVPGFEQSLTDLDIADQRAAAVTR